MEVIKKNQKTILNFLLIKSKEEEDLNKITEYFEQYKRTIAEHELLELVISQIDDIKYY